LQQIPLLLFSTDVWLFPDGPHYFLTKPFLGIWGKRLGRRRRRKAAQKIIFLFYFIKLFLGICFFVNRPN
jgi:hypothetical protein